jgi:1,4-alpha-glucan branching enzyme
MYAHPGKKLLFMGAELGQWREWSHDRSLDWHLLDDPAHCGIRDWVQSLNRVYVTEPALYQVDFDVAGFRWIDCNDNENSVVSFLRYGRDPGVFIVGIFNFTPVPRAAYRIGVPASGFYLELLNSDSALYGGGNVGNEGGVEAEPVPAHGFEHSVSLRVPPLGCLYLKPRR